jgi:ribonuclease HI
MQDLMLFTDGSVNAQSKIGYGAYLAVEGVHHSLDSLLRRVKVRRFEHTSSTKLELQTLLWALSDIQATGRKVTVYTDSQNVTDLPDRRQRFERNDYHSKKNRPLKNADLYREFFRMTDKLNCEFVKVQGHRPSTQKDHTDKVFSLVDKASRNALRRDSG